MDRIPPILWGKLILILRLSENYRLLIFSKHSGIHRAMATRYERQKAANNYTGIELYTPYCFREFYQHRIEARQHQVQISSPIEGWIAANTPYGTIYYHVNLQLKHCTCYTYQEIDISCLHAFALISWSSTMNTRMFFSHSSLLS